MYQLTDIERLLKDVFASLQKGPIRAEVRGGIISFMQNEEQRIINTFKQEILMQENEQLLSRYFHIHQQGLIHLLDKVFLFHNSLRDSKKRNIVELFCAFLTSLLRAIETEFLVYFDSNLKAPEYYFDHFQKDIANPLSSLADRLAKSEIDDTLQQLLNGLISEVSYPDNFTFKKIAFYKRIIPMLLQLDFDGVKRVAQIEAVCKVLLMTNFNSNAFFEYCADHFARLFDECETLSDRTTTVALQLKRIQQIHVIQQVAWDHSARDIKEQLFEWLTYELDYLHARSESVGYDKPNSIPKDFKLKLDASVSQLSYLCRILVETGIIQNKNTSELIRFITKFVSTKKSEAISFDSFRLKFYNPETGTKDAVKNMLQKLQSYITRN